MSGGHFNYEDSYLDSIAEQLEQDIKYNAISWNKPVVGEDEQFFGFQLEPETIKFISGISQQLRQLRTILREYDLAISDDTCEKTFQERVGINGSQQGKL
ncbi:MAG: hypothetical protein DRP47_11080 [Candidatus Zixiibacteriota bacterium]|nr:MAG: hypothetical protein DRP47_11080 [candidate division Zixibacteria bacterium]